MSNPANILKPLHKEALVIAFSDYSKEGDGLHALPNSKNDGEEMTKFLKENIGFESDYVTTIPSVRSGIRPAKMANKATVEKSFQVVVDTARILSRIKQECLFFIYYSGHGCSSGEGDLSAYVPLKKPAAKQEDRTIDLMKWIRMIASFENVYVIAFFDCCRSYEKSLKKANYALVGGHMYIIFSAGVGEAALSTTTATLSEVTQMFLNHARREPQGFENFPVNLCAWEAKKDKAEILDKSSTYVDFSYKFIREEKEVKEDPGFLDYLKRNHMDNISKEEKNKKRDIYKLFNALDSDKSKSVSLDEIFSNLSHLGIKMAELPKKDENPLDKMNQRVRVEVEDMARKYSDVSGAKAISFDSFILFLNAFEKEKEKWLCYTQYTDHVNSVNQILAHVWPQGYTSFPFEDLLDNLLDTLYTHRPSHQAPEVQVLGRALSVNNGVVSKASWDLFVKLWTPRFPITRSDPTGRLFLLDIRLLYDEKYFKGAIDRGTSDAYVKNNPGTFHVRISSQSRFCMTYPKHPVESTLIEYEQYFKIPINTFIENFFAKTPIKPLNH